MLIGTGRLIVVDWVPAVIAIGDSDPGWGRGFGLTFGPVGAQLLGTALAWFASGVVVRLRRQDSIAMASIGVACAMASILVPGGEAGSIAVAWALFGAGLALASRTGCVPRLGDIAAAVVTIAWIPWLVAHLNPDVWVASGAPPMLSLGMRQAMVIAAAGMLSARVQRPSEWRAGAVRLTCATACGFLFIATSFEVHRLVSMWVPGDLTARRAAVSIWWAIVGLGALGGGTVAHRPKARWIGLGMLGAAAAKLVVFDLIEISMVWRVVASMVIGLILLGVAVGYARAMRRPKDVPVAPAGA